MDQNNAALHIVNAVECEWGNHPRFAGVQMKKLLTQADNEYANVNLVRVPSSSEVGRHIHPTQIETVYILAGQAVLTIGDREATMTKGCITAIPAGVEHCLRSVGAEPVELIAFFTPPIG